MMKRFVPRPSLLDSANFEQLKNLGFDTYAINKISCPDGLLWYLTREINLHRTVRYLLVVFVFDFCIRHFM